MAWERRGTAGPFYYRSVRRGGRVVKQYFGKGSTAQQAAQEDEQRRAAREQERRAIVAEMAQDQSIRLMTNDFEEETKLLTEASMLAAGYRRTNYGPWRKQRGN